MGAEDQVLSNLKKAMFSIMKHTGCILEIHDLSSLKEQSHYLTQLSEIDNWNPFYKIEILKLYRKKDNRLMYFLFTLDGKPIIIMPFILNDISVLGKKTPYQDIQSPFGYSGPLFKQGIKDSLVIEFWKVVDQCYKDNNVVSEFIRFSLNNNYRHYSGALINTLKNIKGYILDGDEAQWKGFKPKVRKNYHKAEKNRLTFNMYHKNITKEALDDFYKIYISTMKRNEAEQRYFFSKSYFKNFIDNNPEYCALAIVSHENMPISVELILLSENTMYSFLGGTHSEFFDKRPNDFLKVNTITWGRNHNYSYYILGGGIMNDDGLYRYKKSFFPKDPEVDYKTGRKIINENIYKELVEESLSITYDNDDISEGLFPKYRQHENRFFNIR